MGTGLPNAHHPSAMKTLPLLSLLALGVGLCTAALAQEEAPAPATEPCPPGLGPGPHGPGGPDGPLPPGMRGHIKRESTPTATAS